MKVMQVMMALLDHVKISTVDWVGTVLLTEEQDKLSVSAWSTANLTTNLCADLMVNSMKTTVKCTVLPA
uniref:Uncharacterized protein n=1 Tax=Sphaerodactylus townsendi TaxID=933632 RepID=A0ACB8E7F9_9SAUR